MAIQDPVLLRAGPAQRALHFQEGRASGQVGKPRCRETASCLQSLSALTAWPETGGGPRGRPAAPLALAAPVLGQPLSWRPRTLHPTPSPVAAADGTPPSPPLPPNSGATHGKV